MVGGTCTVWMRSGFWRATALTCVRILMLPVLLLRAAALLPALRRSVMASTCLCASVMQLVHERSSCIAMACAHHAVRTSAVVPLHVGNAVAPEECVDSAGAEPILAMLLPIHAHKVSLGACQLQHLCPGATICP